MIKLTKTNGKEVWINPRHIHVIEVGYDSTVVRLSAAATSGIFYTVKETPEEIVKELEK